MDRLNQSIEPGDIERHISEIGRWLYRVIHESMGNKCVPIEILRHHIIFKNALLNYRQKMNISGCGKCFCLCFMFIFHFLNVNFVSTAMSISRMIIIEEESKILHYKGSQSHKPNALLRPSVSAYQTVTKISHTVIFPHMRTTRYYNLGWFRLRPLHKDTDGRKFSSR